MSDPKTFRARRAHACIAALALAAGNTRAADTDAACVYADIDYGGAHTYMDADTAWIGSA